MENGTQKLKEGMGRVNHRAKQNKWKNEANISTGGKKNTCTKKWQETTWFINE